jgi:hypothetical protein
VAVLQGFLRILWCSVVVNRGEVVVNCAANVVEKQPVFGASKIGHDFGLYFSRVMNSRWRYGLRVRNDDTGADTP